MVGQEIVVLLIRVRFSKEPQRDQNILVIEQKQCSCEEVMQLCAQ